VKVVLCNSQHYRTDMSGSQSRGARCVFVGNIPYETTEEQLIEIFQEVGPVVSFRLVFDRETGKPKGYGFCEFRDQETALSAIRNYMPLNYYSFIVLIYIITCIMYYFTFHNYYVAEIISNPLGRMGYLFRLQEMLFLTRHLPICTK